MKSKGDGLCKKHAPQYLMPGRAQCMGYDEEKEEHISTHPDSLHLPCQSAAHTTLTHTVYTCPMLCAGAQEIDRARLSLGPEIPMSVPS